MGKLWVRLDTNIHQHDKILHLLSLKDGHRAAAMYMFSLSWSGLAESDGHIPDVATNDSRHGETRADVVPSWSVGTQRARFRHQKLGRTAGSWRPFLTRNTRRNRPLDASRRVVGRGILTTASAGKAPVPTTNRASHEAVRVNRC